MNKLDKNAWDVLKRIYVRFASESEFSVSSPEYEKTMIDYFSSQGLLERLDANTLSGWAYIIRPTYEGKLSVSEFANLKSAKIEEFIARGEKIMKDEYHYVDPSSGFLLGDYISGPETDRWFSEINIFNIRALKDHPLHDQIAEVCKKHRNLSSPHEEMMGYLKALASDTCLDEETAEKEIAMVAHVRKTIEQMLADDIERCEEYLNSPDDEVLGQKLYVDITSRYDSIIPELGNGLYQYFAEQHFYDPEISGESLMHNLHALQGKMLSYQAKTYPPTVNENTNTQAENQNSINNKKVFIVHGHDNEAKQELARVLEKSGFEAIILHEQPNAGKTIIEKIERYTDVGYAIVLYTECDIGRDKDVPVAQEKHRARQNVVFEHGYLIAKLGRDHVCALVKGTVETPGDISGVVYVPMDENGAWKMQLAIDMQDVGLAVDMNKFCR